MSILILMLPALCSAGDWSRSDTQRQLLYTTLHVADWLQTRDIAAQCGDYIETNKVLGQCPGTAAVNRYFAVTGLAHVAITHMLPRKARRMFQHVTIMFQANYVSRNHAIGVGMRF